MFGASLHLPGRARVALCRNNSHAALSLAWSAFLIRTSPSPTPYAAILHRLPVGCSFLLRRESAATLPYRVSLPTRREEGVARPAQAPWWSRIRGLRTTRR